MSDAERLADHFRQNPLAYETEPAAWPDDLSRNEIICRLSALIPQWEWVCRTARDMPQASSMQNACRAVRVLELAKLHGLAKADTRIHDVPGRMTLSTLLALCITVRDELTTLAIGDTLSPLEQFARVVGRKAAIDSLKAAGVELDSLTTADRAGVEAWLDRVYELQESEHAYTEAGGIHAARDVEDDLHQKRGAARSALASQTDWLIKRARNTGADALALRDLTDLRRVLTVAAALKAEGALPELVAKMANASRSGGGGGNVAQEALRRVGEYLAAVQEAAEGKPTANELQRHRQYWRYQTIGDAKARKSAVQTGQGVWGGRNALCELEPKIHAGVAQMGRGEYADTFRRKFLDWVDRGKELVYPDRRNDANVNTVEVEAWAEEVGEVYSMLRSLDAHLSARQPAESAAPEPANNGGKPGRVANRRDTIKRRYLELRKDTDQYPTQESIIDALVAEMELVRSTIMDHLKAIREADKDFPGAPGRKVKLRTNELHPTDEPAKRRRRTPQYRR